MLLLISSNLLRTNFAHSSSHVGVSQITTTSGIVIGGVRGWRLSVTLNMSHSRLAGPRFGTIVQLSHVLFKVKISTKSFRTNPASEGFLLIVSVHVKCEIVHLMECFVTNTALECLLSGMCQFVIFVISC